MIIDMQSSVFLEDMLVVPDWVYGNRPSLPTEIRETIILTGTGSTPSITLTGTVDD